MEGGVGLEEAVEEGGGGKQKQAAAISPVEPEGCVTAALNNFPPHA